MNKKFFNVGTSFLVAGFFALATSYYTGSISADTLTASQAQYLIFTLGFIVGFALVVTSAVFFVLAVTRKPR